jgi:hypothetical protein
LAKKALIEKWKGEPKFEVVIITAAKFAADLMAICVNLASAVSASVNMLIKELFRA